MGKSFFILLCGLWPSLRVRGGLSCVFFRAVLLLGVGLGGWSAKEKSASGIPLWLPRRRRKRRRHLGWGGALLFLVFAARNFVATRLWWWGRRADEDHGDGDSGLGWVGVFPVLSAVVSVPDFLFPCHVLVRKLRRVTGMLRRWFREGEISPTPRHPLGDRFPEGFV